MTQNRSQAFARKYRPRKFKDVVGQEHATLALKNTFSASPMTHHAFLFTGTRGVGKTTLARICAKLANCSNRNKEGEPCLECSSCFEIEHGSSINYMEMDGASNNGVEQIRQLIETTNYMPVDAPKKVYVIDEVHMLSQSAFNALLKTLEEPPEHVIFIFATTEVQKIPETILSRCLRFDLRPLSLDAIFSHLKFILESENIVFDNDKTLRALAHCARGSVRDSLNLLEQVLALSPEKKITDTLVSLSLGRLQQSQVQQVVSALIEGKASELSSLYQKIMQSSIDLETFCLQIHEELYIRLQTQVQRSEGAISLEEYFWLYEQMSKDFQWLPKSMNPQNVLNAVLLKYALRHTFSQTSELLSHQNPSSSNSLSKKKRELSAEELWQEVYVYLQQESPTAATTWAHTWGAVETSDGDTLLIKVFYKEADSFLVESFTSNQWWNKAKAFITNLYEQNETQMRIELIQVTEGNSGKNIIEMEEEAAKNKDEQRKMDILHNSGVRQIESIFNAKVDKVQLK